VISVSNDCCQSQPDEPEPEHVRSRLDRVGCWPITRILADSRSGQERIVHPNAAGRCREMARVKFEDRFTPLSLTSSAAVVVGLSVVSLLHATLLLLMTTTRSHAVWAMISIPVYVVAAALGLGLRTRSWSILVGFVGSVLVPTVYLAIARIRQEEVTVTERAFAELVNCMPIYPSAPPSAGDLNPYLPGMSIWGVPAFFIGLPIGDARIWILLFFVVALALCARSMASLSWRECALATALVSQTSIVALAASVGGVDLPVIGLALCALALMSRPHAVFAAPVLLALCLTMKWTAWPLVAVMAAYLFAVHGRRSILRVGLAALCGALPFLLFLWYDPTATLQNVLYFPLGRGPFPSPAASPFPGYLIARTFGSGWVIDIILMLVAILAILWRLASNPPTNSREACNILAIGLLAATMMAPASRFGYLAYPWVLWLLPWLLDGRRIREKRRSRTTIASTRNGR
jgi:hypothetical protein